MAIAPAKMSARHMVSLASQTDFAGWRDAARALALQGVDPSDVSWTIDGNDAGDLFASPGVTADLPPISPNAELRVPRRFVDLERPLFRLRQSGDDAGKRFVRRPFLQFENEIAGRSTPGVGPEPVERLGGKSDDASILQDAKGLRHHRSIRLVRIDGEDSRHDRHAILTSIPTVSFFR